MKRRVFLSQAACAGAGLLAPVGLWANTYPSRPVKLIDAYAPGSASDTILRLIAPQMSEALGQPFIVENKPGASGNLAAKYLTTLSADGHAFLMATNSMLTTNPHLFPSNRVEPQRDLSYVMPVCDIGMVIVGGPATPAKNFAGVMAQAKARPGTVTYGTPGVGSPMHLIAEMLNQRAGMGLSHVPYKGGAPMIADVMAGQLAIGIVAYSVVAGFFQSGRLTPLAVTGTRRLAALPQVPALSELYPEVNMSAWTAIVAPRGTPKALRERFAAEAGKALARPDVVTRLRELGLERIPGDEKTVEAMVSAEYTRVGELIQKLNIRME